MGKIYCKIDMEKVEKIINQKGFYFICTKVLYPDFVGPKYIIVGGAYSVDKFYRLSRGMKWWPDEQPSPVIKEYVEQQLADNTVDIVFSHTCPAKYIPTECFLSCIDQSKVDNSTEQWLDTIEDKINYEAWYLGHWHTDKRIDRMHFLFHGIEVLE